MRVAAALAVSLAFRKTGRVAQFGGLFRRRDLMAGPGTQVDLGRPDALVLEPRLCSTLVGPCRPSKRSRFHWKLQSIADEE